MTLIALAAIILVLCPGSALSAREEGKKKGPGRAQAKKPSPGKAEKGRKRPPLEFFAIQSFESLTAGELAALQAARIGTHRVPIAWHEVERAPGARNWGRTDRQVGLAALYGIRVLPILLGTPLHLAPDNAHPPVRAAAAMNGWSLFAADAARRYGPGGEFWQQYPGLPHVPVTQWQVWNEPSNVHAWPSAVDSGEYASLVIQTAAAVREVDPDAAIMLAGLLPNTDDPSGQPLGSYLRELYRVPGIKRSFDAVALHPYSIKPRGALRLARRVRKVMRRNGDRKTPLWITELGWATGGTGERPLVTSLEGQARKLRKTYRLLLAERRRLRLGGIVWLAMRDFNRVHPEWWPFQMGLFTAQRVAKPAWYTLARVTGGVPAPIVEPPAGTAPAPPPPPEPEPDPCFLLLFC